MHKTMLASHLVFYWLKCACSGVGFGSKTLILSMLETNIIDLTSSICAGDVFRCFIWVQPVLSGLPGLNFILIYGCQKLIKYLNCQEKNQKGGK